MFPFPFQYIPAKGAPPLKPQERALSQWRRLNVPETEKAHGLHARTMAEIVPKVSATLRLEKRQSEAEIIRVWNNLLDPQIIVHAQPTGYNKGTLLVTVDSSVWLSEIVRYRRREIIDRLRHSFGEEVIKKISFRLG